jgi:hypothetical protein
MNIIRLMPRHDEYSDLTLLIISFPAKIAFL